jgi:hypothetical protein
MSSWIFSLLMAFLYPPFYQLIWGLPLHIRKPTRSCLQPLVQKVGDRLPGWKRNFLSYPGRELLVKIVLSAMPTHIIIVFKPPK